MKPLTDFDFTPRRVEKSGELEAVAWAENNGWLVRKMSYEGRAGAPDRIFFGYGHIVLIEMKREKVRNHKDGGLSKGQVEEHRRIREHGSDVYVAYTAAEAIAVLRAHMRGHIRGDLNL